MKQIIVIAGLILIGVAIYGLVTEDLQTAVGNTLYKSVTYLNDISP